MSDIYFSHYQFDYYSDEFRSKEVQLFLYLSKNLYLHLTN